MIDRRSSNNIILLVGTDGCGKTFFANWLNDLMLRRGLTSSVFWSRFNNYFSKPLLGLLRVSGHNYYKEFSNIKFGYHDFENLSIIRSVYIALQMIDTNIATYLNIIRFKNKFDIMICERGPYDTIIDVMADTGIQNLKFKKGFVLSLKYVKKVFFIDRNIHEILKKRPELIYDNKLRFKSDMYRKLCDELGWCYINNNDTIESTKEQILLALE